MKLSHVVVFGIVFSTLSQLANPTPVKGAVEKPESVSQGLLRSAVMLRLDRTDATDLASSDKGSAIVIAELDRVVENYSVQVSSLRNGAHPEEVTAVKEALTDIFALMPKTNIAFNRIIQGQSQTAPHLVDGLRRTIKRALNVSATHTELRVHALDLLIERMELHNSLASGPNGPQFLSTFSIWLNEITGWRNSETAPSSLSVTTVELQRIARSDYLYKNSFGAMMCSKLFTTAPLVQPKGR